MYSICLAKLPPMDFVDFAKSALSAIGFGSNFFFYYSTTEYGADSALLKPLLHTWSLGVEEQFYIVFPIFITFDLEICSYIVGYNNFWNVAGEYPIL